MGFPFVSVARGRPVRLDPAARPAPVERPVCGSGPVPPPAREKRLEQDCQDFLKLSPDRATACASVARSRCLRGKHSGFAPPPLAPLPLGWMLGAIWNRQPGARQRAMRSQRPARQRICV